MLQLSFAIRHQTATNDDTRPTDSYHFCFPLSVTGSREPPSGQNIFEGDILKQITKILYISTFVWSEWLTSTCDTYLKSITFF